MKLAEFKSTNPSHKQSVIVRRISKRFYIKSVEYSYTNGATDGGLNIRCIVAGNELILNISAKELGKEWATVFNRINSRCIGPMINFEFMDISGKNHLNPINSIIKREIKKITKKSTNAAQIIAAISSSQRAIKKSEDGKRWIKANSSNSIANNAKIQLRGSGPVETKINNIF